MFTSQNGIETLGVTAWYGDEMFSRISGSVLLRKGEIQRAP